MTINQILEYVMTTPENTNGTILKQMLNELAAASSVDEDSIKADYLQSLIGISGEEEYATAAECSDILLNKVVFVYDPSTKSLTKVVGAAAPIPDPGT